MFQLQQVTVLQQLLKNEVRELGKAMGLPGQLINRQPFPEPGLAIRIIGEVTREKVALLQEADHIFRSELENQGLEAVVPGQKAQADVMHLIFGNIKAGRPPEIERFHAAARNLRDAGAEAIILGCTELSLIKRDYPIGPGFLDAMEVLAREAVLSCGYPLKEQYNCLITC